VNRVNRHAAGALLAALAATLFAALPAAADSPTVVVDLDPKVLGVGDTAFLTIEVRGGVFTNVRFDPSFELTNFEQVGNPASSSNVQWINGVTTRSLRHTWRLQAGQLGLATVSDIRVQVGDDRFDLPAVEAQVVEDPPASARRRPPAPGPAMPRNPGPGWRLRDPLADRFRRGQEDEPKVRLLAEVSPPVAWAGEQVTYTLWLYTQTDIRRISLREMPDFNGFWVEEIPRRDDLPTEPTTLDGESFFRTPLLRRALFALGPGEFDVDPVEVSLTARVARSGFFRSLSTAQPMELASNPVRLEIRPLPAPPPELAADFGGLVGDLRLDARLVPSELAVGDAANLELTLSGHGNVEGMATPRLDLPEGLSALPAGEAGGNRVPDVDVEAERTWSWPLVPERPGTWRLPTLGVVYFDPASGEYRRAEAPPLMLRARRGEPETALAGGPALHPIKNAALPPDESPAPRIAATLPWLFALPWALVLTVALVRLRNGGERRNAGPLTRFEARLAEAVADERPRQTAIAVEAAWVDLLAERFDVPPGTPPSRWSAALAASAVDARLRDALDELIDDLHYLRNAPQLSTTAELTGELAERSRRLARRLAA